MKDETFEKAMTVLQNFYGAVTVLDGDFLESLYFKALEHLTDEQLMFAVATCIKKNPRQYGFFPSAEQLLEYAGLDIGRPPGENYTAQQPTNYLALPSTEMVVEGMTPEQRMAVLQALRLEAEARKNKRKLRNKGLTPIGEVLDPSLARKTVLEDMRKYLQTGIDELRQRAINWASDPDNGCELVKVEGCVVDIREMDF